MNAAREAFRRTKCFHIPSSVSLLHTGWWKWYFTGRFTGKSAWRSQSFQYGACKGTAGHGRRNSWGGVGKFTTFGRDRPLRSQYCHVIDKFSDYSLRFLTSIDRSHLGFWNSTSFRKLWTCGYCKLCPSIWSNIKTGSNFYLLGT